MKKGHLNSQEGWLCLINGLKHTGLQSPVLTKLACLDYWQYPTYTLALTSYVVLSRAKFSFALYF
jgi:hypothetical protein